MGSIYDYSQLNGSAWLGFKEAYATDVIIDGTPITNDEIWYTKSYIEIPSDNVYLYRHVEVYYYGTNMMDLENGKMIASFGTYLDGGGSFSWNGEVKMSLFDGTYTSWEIAQIILEGNDIIIGTNYDDILNALDGNDKIYGYGGPDSLTGAAGNDFIHGHWGRDNITGGIGNDELRGGDGGDTIYGGNGADVIWGGGHKNTLDAGINDGYVDQIVVHADASLYNLPRDGSYADALVGIGYEDQIFIHGVDDSALSFGVASMPNDPSQTGIGIYANGVLEATVGGYFSAAQVDAMTTGGFFA